MLSVNDIKEELSYAYLHAVAARAGFGSDRPHNDRDSIDVVISAKGSLASDSRIRSPRIEIQLKATSLTVPNSEKIAYSLPIKNYNDLRGDRALPGILLLFCLPEEDAAWLNVNEDQLVAKRCGYWLNLKGQPASENETTVTVYVPRANVLTVEKLKELMTKASRLEDLT
jgi:hypothetical protein